MRWGRPAAGREPAAAALLGWLEDAKAPGLCLVSGGSRSGKSELLAWLVHHGMQAGNPLERTVHAVVPDAGRSVHGTVWSMADQLRVVARTPGELVAALNDDARRSVIVLPDLHSEAVAEVVLDLVRLPHVRLVVESRTGSPAHRLLSPADCAEMDLDLDRWRDRDRFDQWLASGTQSRGSSDPAATVEEVDLSDPVAVCKADPRAVTVGYEGDDSDHGGLRSAWLRVGQALHREKELAMRAVVLAAALGDGADPRLAPTLAELASQASWRLEWTRVRGDRMPPWPGPAAALAMGKGPLAHQLVVAGHQETVRVVDLSDAGARGRFVSPCGVPQSVAVVQDGTVILLDGRGRIHTETSWVSARAKAGLESLLVEGPSDVERLVSMVSQHTGTAVAAVTDTSGGFVVLGGAGGTVTSFNQAGVKQELLHAGPVTSVAGISLASDGEERTPLVYSGGADGKVRAWAPGNAPMTEPVIQRPCPVVSLDACDTAQGPALVVAWLDGAVDWIHVDTAVRRTFRPGPPVRSVSITTDNHVVVGMDEALVCLSPSPPSRDEGPRRLAGHA